MPVDPQIEAMLAATPPWPGVRNMDLATLRQAVRDSSVMLPPPPDAPVAAVEDRTIDGPGGPLGLRLYTPEGSAPFPVIIYCHGGGYVVGDLDTQDMIARALCAWSGAIVVSVDYRLAPEHPFPAAPDDTFAALQWAAGHAADFGGDPDRIAVGGDSAGGNLAAVVSIALRDAGESWLRFQLLIYPATDMRQVADSHRRNGEGYLLTTDAIRWFREHYMGPEADITDWRASPLLASNLSGLPPALVITAGFDPLRDEGRQYADALSAAGTRAQYVCFERQLHGFINMTRVIPEAHTAVRLAADACARALG